MRLFHIVHDLPPATPTWNSSRSQSPLQVTLRGQLNLCGGGYPNASTNSEVSIQFSPADYWVYNIHVPFQRPTTSLPPTPPSFLVMPTVVDASSSASFSPLRFSLRAVQVQMCIHTKFFQSGSANECKIFPCPVQHGSGSVSKITSLEVGKNNGSSVEDMHCITYLKSV
jgi:hypothetical protein